MQTPDPNLNDELSAPPQLVAGLKRVSQGPELFVPRTVDEAVLRASRRHLDRRAGIRWSWRRWLVGLSAATAVIVVALLSWERPGPAAWAREDVNRDGRVDIVDALVLARSAGSGAPGLDLNGDGNVDEQDAALVAAKAVQLHPGI